LVTGAGESAGATAVYHTSAELTAAATTIAARLTEVLVM